MSSRASSPYSSLVSILSSSNSPLFSSLIHAASLARCFRSSNGVPVKLFSSIGPLAFARTFVVASQSLARM